MFDFGRDIGQLLAQWWRRHKQVLAGDFGKGSMEWPIAAKPFIDNDAQGVLIAGRLRPTLKLFRSHVRGGADDFLGRLLPGSLSDKGDAKITQEQLISGAKSHIFR